jgi:putative Ca2+/H+ antiporter (TMEM165/GDT1 family)
VHLFSVGLGELLGLTIPTVWIQLAAGVAFIAFGLWTLRGDTIDEDDRFAEHRFGPLLTVGITFFLAELGDKTMLMTVTIASEQRSFVSVWLGSTLGMVPADGLAILVGRMLGARLPEKVIRYGAAAVLLITGAASLLRAASALR